MAARKLTVVQVLPALESGGVERGTVEVAAELVRQGHRSIVISAGGRLVPELLAAGSEHIAWPIGHKSLFTLRFVRRLRTWLRAQQVDILHARSRLPAWIAYLAWRKLPAHARPRFVTTVHGFYSVSAYSAIMTRGERVIAVSRSIADYIRDNYPKTDPRRIEVIPRGIDAHEFPFGFTPDAQWLQRWYADFPQLQGREVLTLPGRITRLKGHEEFLHLIDRLRADRPRVHGLIVGGVDPRRGAYARELHRMVARMNLTSAITFTGIRSDVREIFASSSLVLSLSSKPESFGRTVLEALSLGVPVVGYDHGGVGEVLGQIYPAGRVARGDADQLASKVNAMLDAPPAVPSTHGFQRQTMLDQIVTTYQKLCIAPDGAG